MRKFYLALFFLVFFSLVPTASADSFSYTLINQNMCSTAPYGFTATWLGGRSGCLEGSVCVMSSPTAGDPPNTPTCMPNEAAARVNYTDNVSCSAACGHSCTANSNNHITTYYCASTACTDVPQTSLSCATYAGNLGIPANFTQGSLSWTANSCFPSDQSKWKYTGGCSAPATSGIQQGTAGNNQVQTGSGGTNTGTNIKLINPLQGGGNLQTFLLNILDFIIRIGAIVVVLMLVYVGYLFVAAQGEPAKITTARSALLWTVVGALILLGSKAISLGIEATVRAISVGQ